MHVDKSFIVLDKLKKLGDKSFNLLDKTKKLGNKSEYVKATFSHKNIPNRQTDLVF